MKKVLLSLLLLVGVLAPAVASAQQAIDVSNILWWDGGTPRCDWNIASGAPSGGSDCDFYIDYSSAIYYVKKGGSWIPVGNITGTLTATRVPFASGANALTDDADMTFTGGDTLNITKVNSPSVRNTYTSGFAGAGFTLDYGVSTASKSTVEVDNLSSRGIFSVYELLVHQVRATNGSLFISATGEASAVVANGGSSYTITTSTDHGFLVNDLVRSQRFTGTSTWQSDLTVTAVGSTTSFTATLAGGTTVPAVGMEYVRLGNTGTTSRQNSIYLTADDTNNPYISVQAGVAAFADWNTSAKTRVRVGNLNGSYGYVADTYGFAAGDASAANITMDATNGLRIRNATTDKITLDAAGNATFVGSITAASGTIGGFNIGAEYIRDVANSMGLASTVTGGDDVRFWAGETFANRATAPFRVTEAGAMTAASGLIADWTIASGRLIKDTGVDATSSGLDPAQYPFYAGATLANRATAPFHVTAAGAMTATSGEIAGCVLATGSLTCGTSNDVAVLSSSDSTYRFWTGNATAASAPYRVGKDGSIYLGVAASGFATAGSLNYTRASGLGFGQTGDIYGMYSTVAGGDERLNISNTIVGTSSTDGTARVNLTAVGWDHTGPSASPTGSVEITSNPATAKSLVSLTASVISLASTSLATTSGATFDAVNLRIDSGHMALNVAVDSTVAFYLKSATSGSGAFIQYWLNSSNATEFYVRDDGYGFLNDTAWHYSSDRRLKDHTAWVTDGLERISLLKPAYYDRKDGRLNQIGFYAQDVIGAVPQAVEMDRNGYYSVATDYFMPLMVDAIKTLNARLLVAEQTILALKKAKK